MGSFETIMASGFAEQEKEGLKDFVVSLSCLVEKVLAVLSYQGKAIG